MGVGREPGLHGEIILNVAMCVSQAPWGLPTAFACDHGSSPLSMLLSF